MWTAASGRRCVSLGYGSEDRSAGVIGKLTNPGNHSGVSCHRHCAMPGTISSIPFSVLKPVKPGYVPGFVYYWRIFKRVCLFNPLSSLGFKSCSRVKQVGYYPETLNLGSVRKRWSEPRCVSTRVRTPLVSSIYRRTPQANACRLG